MEVLLTVKKGPSTPMPQMPPAIKQFIDLQVRNYKTTVPGLGVLLVVCWNVYSRIDRGEGFSLSEAEWGLLSASAIGIYAKAHNVTGGDTSNGMVPNPAQEVKAQAEVVETSGKPAPTPESEAKELARIQKLAALQAEADRVKAEINVLEAEAEK